jgi:hypothetical protein
VARIRTARWRAAVKGRERKRKKKERRMGTI